ncbi:MAG: UBP-type zinc finger domain-containing protein [Actinomycetota bacterium]
MRGASKTDCRHSPKAEAAARTSSCEECGAWAHLRVCTQCGHVGCCETLQGHNTAHYHETGHPVIRSLPLGPSSFTWCYRCDRYTGGPKIPKEASET